MHEFNKGFVRETNISKKEGSKRIIFCLKCNKLFPFCQTLRIVSFNFKRVKNMLFLPFIFIYFKWASNSYLHSWIISFFLWSRTWSLHKTNLASNLLPQLSFLSHIHCYSFPEYELFPFFLPPKHTIPWLEKIGKE